MGNQGAKFSKLIQFKGHEKDIIYEKLILKEFFYLDKLNQAFHKVINIIPLDYHPEFQYKTSFYNICPYYIFKLLLLIYLQHDYHINIKLKAFPYFNVKYFLLMILQ